MALTSPLGDCTDFSRRAAAPYLAPEVRVCFRKVGAKPGKAVRTAFALLTQRVIAGRFAPRPCKCDLPNMANKANWLITQSISLNLPPYNQEESRL